MNTLLTKTMPLMFAGSGDQAIPGLRGPLAIPRDAAGIVVLTVRRLERAEAMVVLSALEERVVNVLQHAGAEVPLHQRVPATVPLPPGIAGNGVPIVALTLNVADEGCCFWNPEAAGEMPHEVIEQLRPYLLLEEDGEENSMKKNKRVSSIQITRFDKTRLMRLLRSLDAASENRDEMQDLERELERGIEVESTDVEGDVVTMNSTVRVTDLDANTTHLYTIVFPSDADFEKGRISILSPLGTALLGYRAGDVVTWEMPRGTRRLRIEALVYQPEAAGDYHL